MVKRLISSNASDILKMSAQELKQSISASEGRVIMSENVVFREAFVDDITNAELARAFGADMILLNGIDVLNPVINGLSAADQTFVESLHHLVGRPIGVNLEPVDETTEMAETRLEIVEGRKASLRTIQEIEKIKLDFVCFTGNPGTGVSNKEILKTIKLARENFSGLIIAGKMHGAGATEKIIDEETVKAFIEAGADIILVPAVGTVPGFDMEDLKPIVKCAHAKNTLVLSAIGTSQESSDPDTIKQIAIQNKICGVDIQHIGDAGYAGVAPVENIFAISKAIRGMRHTASMIARSINR
ncbi:haloacid dehalogenase-like hydrolase [Vagococcus xieshaowenii]|uniref:Haloacid dehalogenase-like hydrolase n=1 Tax=Vagococcus xieshaowenii TaxID=2562451 RepID=A0AAJ5EF60_9ENTE|nr:haloacid dehalogenase-like hydrolase [Vagococcus xieshaowenii]QCA29338.1 haloacid dehalogenase-like hydrolase [Vagococcus xieshaowenii]TFZ42458.1 haloacid dehalogenase-like hydrolase [Vagococcus xieshaowenii]